MGRTDEGLSRRDFLALSGAASAGAALLAEGEEVAQAAAPGAERAARELGPAEVPVRLLVNGTEHRVRVEPRATLAASLRDQLGLTGTKIGCDRGACGACTVWVDGQPQPACMTLTLDVAGIGGPGDAPPRPVTTIEGLARRGALHPVQEAFIEKDALQCGFCTPGMIMSCAALCERTWSRGGKLEEADVRRAIAGNLCRCGAYPNIVAATLAAHGKPGAGSGRAGR